jgi:KDO2-lipid IV(A) lauroyltransferase
MYYFVFGVLYLISLLPFPVLYLLSDLFYLVTYYIVGYRKEVVLNNLAIAFPDKTVAERIVLAKKFYRNFCDNWTEALKMMSISEQAIGRRISSNLEACDAIYKSGRSCQILLGHQFNWEWCNASVPVRVPFKVLVAYSPLSNQIMDRLFLYIRQRFGCIMLPFNDMRRAMLPYRHSQYILGLVADQNPSNPLRSYWLDFLNTPTAFLQGPEKGARIGNIPVIYMAFSKPRRGYYHIEAVLMHDNPRDTREGELTKQYVSLLEENIRLHPELYLWSHRRWKHEWKEEYGKLWVNTASVVQAE